MFDLNVFSSITKKIIFILFLLTILSGCSNKMEIDRINFPVALGIDFDEKNNEIKIYAQLLSTATTSTDGEQQASKTYMVLEGHGTTLLDAMADITSQGSQNLSWKHITVVVITDKMAKHGIIDELDLLSRFQQVHLNSYLIVTKEDLKELLESKPKIETSMAAPLAGIRLLSKQSSQIKPITLRDFIMAYLSGGMDPVIPEVSIIKDAEETTDKSKEKEIGLDYTKLGICKDDKLVGFLDDDETKGAVLIYGMEDISRITIPPSKEGKEDEFTIRSIHSIPEIIPNMHKNTPSITLKLNIYYTIAQINTSTKVDTKKTDSLNKQVESYVKKNVEATFKKTQKELSSDIFGFGDKIYRKYPDYWLKHKDNWNNIFQKIDIKVQVKANLNNTGQTLNSLKYTHDKE
ncbi:MAG TPA: hypothetical protein DCP90_08895 [Clostridiales bacterium]|nr:hypothetical protein [Clostridiales bacterium]